MPHVFQNAAQSFARNEVAPFHQSSAARHPGDSALAVGRKLLIGDGIDADPQRGLALITEAAKQGDAEAYNALATMTAAGAWTQQSWPRALELLQEAAERGSPDARQQLRLLATNPDASSWRELRESIDLERCVTPSQPPQQICESPRIWRADGFATPAQCDRLIAQARGRLAPAKMYDRTTHSIQFNAIRTNSEFVFDITRASVMLVLMRIKIGLLVSLPVPHMEPPQILHYAPGQELKAHFDFLRGNSHAGYGRDGQYHGDRVVTFLLYLNDGYEGGETDFPRAKLRYKGRKGDALFFANLRSGEPDPASLHCGTPILQGEKWLFSQWIHDRPFTA